MSEYKAWGLTFKVGRHGVVYRKCCGGWVSSATKEDAIIKQSRLEDNEKGREYSL